VRPWIPQARSLAPGLPHHMKLHLQSSN